jgi:hypothetical protein
MKIESTVDWSNLFTGNNNSDSSLEVSKSGSINGEQSESVILTEVARQQQEIKNEPQIPNGAELQSLSKKIESLSLERLSLKNFGDK